MKKILLLIVLILGIGIVPGLVRADDPECGSVDVTIIVNQDDTSDGVELLDVDDPYEADYLGNKGFYQIHAGYTGYPTAVQQGWEYTFSDDASIHQIVLPAIYRHFNDQGFRFYVDDVLFHETTLTGYPIAGTPFNYEFEFDTLNLTAGSRIKMLSYNPTDDISSIAMHSVEFIGVSDCYFKPVADADADAWGMVEKQNPASEPQDHAIFAYSSMTGLNVYSPISTTVTSVRRTEFADCPENFGFGSDVVIPFQASTCSFNTPDSDARLFDGAAGGNYNTWTVTLSDPATARVFTYFVADADLYVTEGQSITGGCLIGKTMRIDSNEVPLRYLDQGAAIVTVAESGTIIDAIAAFTLDPDPAAPCNQDEQYQECMGDVQLRDPAAWVTSSDVVFLNPGFGLGAGQEYISTTINLDGTQEPELIVRAKRWQGSDGKLELTLGQTVTTQTLTSHFTNYGTVSITGGAHEADGTFYTIRVKNLSGGYIDIQSVCVRFTADDEGEPIPDLPDIEDPPDQEQQACIFAQNSFNTGTGSWSVSGSVEGASGEIRVPSGQTFSQNVTVAAGEYTLSLVAAVWSYSEYSPDDQDTSSDIEFSYDFDGSASMGSKTFGEYAQNNNLVVYQTSLSIASDTTDDFTFVPTISDPPSGVRGVIVRAVCIDDGDYGDGTGGGSDGSGGGDDTPFEESCSPIAQPSGSNSSIGTWISWLWVKLNGFYRCELIILLNNMYKLMRTAWLTTSWSIRWTEASTRQTFKWFAEDWTFWLGGHLSNIAVGQVTTIVTDSGGTCGNLFCLLQTLVEGIQGLGTSIVDGIRDVLELLIGGLHDLLSRLLDMIQQLLNFFLGAAGLVIGLAVQFVALLLHLIGIAAELFQLLIQAVVTVVNAWIQATPQDLIPSCALDQTSARCMFFYIAERTVFTESGALFMPTVAGAIYLALILWVIRRITSALRDLGTLS